jgi:hypothetical protein
MSTINLLHFKSRILGPGIILKRGRVTSTCTTTKATSTTIIITITTMGVAPSLLEMQGCKMNNSNQWYRLGRVRLAAARPVWMVEVVAATATGAQGMGMGP